MVILLNSQAQATLLFENRNYRCVLKYHVSLCSKPSNSGIFPWPLNHPLFLKMLSAHEIFLYCLCPLVLLHTYTTVALPTGGYIESSRSIARYMITPRVLWPLDAAIVREIILTSSVPCPYHVFLRVQDKTWASERLQKCHVPRVFTGPKCDWVTIQTLDFTNAYCCT